MSYIPHGYQRKNTFNVMGASLPVLLTEGKILKFDLSQ
jgi:hypothetical protein